ncbi:MAG: hypothetical protein M1831_007568 [Alyxoria varia]|nr:MAG: hypothetical protein M1831_007568 [Alyxoria varia]
MEALRSSQHLPIGWRICLMTAIAISLISYAAAQAVDEWPKLPKGYPSSQSKAKYPAIKVPGFIGFPTNKKKAEAMNKKGLPVVPNEAESKLYCQPFDRERTMFWTANTDSFAERYAEEHGYVTINDALYDEFWGDKRVGNVVPLNLVERNRALQKACKAWVYMAFAVLAKGTVLVTTLADTHPRNSWWCEWEWPVLLRNPNVNKVVSIWIEPEWEVHPFDPRIPWFNEAKIKFLKTEFDRAKEQGKNDHLNPYERGHICNAKKWQESIRDTLELQKMTEAHREALAPRLNEID